MAEKKKNPLKVVTPKFRLSFPELFTPKSFEEDENKVYSIKMIFDKKTDLTALKNVVAKAAKEKWGDNIPKGLVKPFQDGDEKELENYKGKIVVGASSKFKPQVCDKDPDIMIETPEEIYPGCYARAAIIAYAWEYSKKKGGPVIKRGVSFRLESVQKIAEGESFVSRPDVKDTFDDVSEGENDDDNYEPDDPESEIFEVDDDFMN